MIVFGFLLLLVQPLAAQERKVRIIVRGDDMGMARAVNAACIDAFQNGIMQSVEVMVPAPWFPGAAALLRRHPDLDVGVHLVLTSEWENLKWRPLTHAPSLVDENGYFFPMIWPNPNFPESRVLLKHAWKLDEIERELRAQIEMALREIPHVSHLSYHMGCNDMAPEVNALVKKLAGEYGLDIDLEAQGVKGMEYAGPHETPEEKIQAFTRALDGLAPGTYLFVDHPGYLVPEMKSIGHVGYDNVGEDREGVTRLFTDPAVKAAIEQRNIELISYKQLRHP